MAMKRSVWQIDALFGLIMAGLIGWAYWIDGPGAPSNAIKPVVTKTDHRLLCIDGQPPVEWRCPDGDRL